MNDDAAAMSTLQRTEDSFRPFSISADDRFSPQKQQQANLWHNGQLCDVEIVASDGSTFQCHRLVLASSSDYMNALLSEDRFRDSTDCPVHLPDVSPDTVRLLLNWFYRGECAVVSFAQCAALLEAANQLQCQALIKELQWKLSEKDAFGVDYCVRLFLPPFEAVEPRLEWIALG